jgi:hypothetical protein
LGVIPYHMSSDKSVNLASHLPLFEWIFSLSLYYNGGNNWGFRPPNRHKQTL